MKEFYWLKDSGTQRKTHGRLWLAAGECSEQGCGK